MAHGCTTPEMGSPRKGWRKGGGCPPSQPRVTAPYEEGINITTPATTTPLPQRGRRCSEWLSHLSQVIAGRGGRRGL